MITLLILVALGASALAVWFRRRWQEDERKWKRELRAERERHAAAEHAHQARMEAMLDGMIEGLLVLDANGRIALANRAAEQMFQFSRMMVGGSVLETLRNPQVAALAARAATAEQAIEHEVQLEGAAPRILHISAVALHDALGAVAGAVLVFHDVTRLRQLEAMRQEFVANVSHELRTPLSLIKSAVETLIDGGKNDPTVTSRFLEIIDKHANRLTRLIDDLLLLARLDSGHLELNLGPVPLRAAAQEALDDAALAARARHIALVNNVPADVAAEADPERLRQALANLIDNAIKYGRADGRVTLQGRALDGERVEIAVCDDGPGIPPEAKSRIFERFYRVDKARSREQGGTGLGLAIVKNVVQAHRGDVRVESTPGKGTAFFITLPAAQSE
jgi:two-component system, OmpR family, phosphate regulon sensor histidine kinase PhoR